MRNINDLKIYLLDRNPEMYAAWNNFFSGHDNVTVICSEFTQFMRSNKVDCVVSPANSYGIMDGGYDEAITAWFGESLMKKVQQYIIDNFYGEQPLCTSFIIDTDVQGVKLIHTPTMRIPSMITDNRIVYHCTRSCLISALNSDVKSVVVPAFGGLTGCVPRNTVAQMMWFAFDQLKNTPNKIDWEYANSRGF